MDGKKTSVTLLCPALVKETLERLQNPRLLKLCMDGTYRLLYGKYVLLSVGALSKQWSAVHRVDRSHQSSFNELGFAIAHAENDVAYSGLVQSVLMSAANSDVTLTQVAYGSGMPTCTLASARRDAVSCLRALL